MADPLDLLTLDEGKHAVSIHVTDDRDDEVLPGYITAVSRLLDQRIGPTVVRTITAEEHDVCGQRRIVLNHRPVTSVTAMTEYETTTGVALTRMTVTSHPENGFRLYAYTPQEGLFDGRVSRMSGDRWQRFLGPVQVTYVAGRVQSTTTVDARIKRAAGICLENLWRDRQQSAGSFGEFDVPTVNFPTFALPRGAADLLAEELGQNEPWGIA